MTTKYLKRMTEENAQEYFNRKYQEYLATPGNYRVDAFHKASTDLRNAYGEGVDVDYETMTVEFDDDNE